ncbi:hypothetical protein [Paraburkholderia sp.]|uniref:hypothetical protein n=1 Tax=Paraburkholderia sp. TaxID=1926495 RepID=UPI0023A68655|nr:hypothetical protein [Paraburkholderia sp.]MDE1183028.1 hypothetical protein [Paraburkholderia sp.]
MTISIRPIVRSAWLLLGGLGGLACAQIALAQQDDTPTESSTAPSYSAVPYASPGGSKSTNAKDKAAATRRNNGIVEQQLLGAPDPYGSSLGAAGDSADTGSSASDASSDPGPIRPKKRPGTTTRRPSTLTASDPDSAATAVFRDPYKRSGTPDTQVYKSPY